MKYVIIGSGIAGVTAAKTIRNIDKDGEIILIGEENYFPYNRYRLTSYLNGRIGDEQMFYSSPDYFRDLEIIFRKGEAVKTVDVESKAIKLFHNEVMSYDKLLVATGGKPSLGRVLYHFEHFIQKYYSLEDILLLKKKLSHINICIVSGEGLSTLDLLCGLCNLNKKVIYITRMERALFPLIESEFGDEIHDFLISKGVEVICEDRIISIEERNSQRNVTTFKGLELSGDAVFASDDYKPNISVVQKTPIEKKWGILVDQYLKTSVDHVYAAGDCVEIYHPVVKDYWINFGWPNAIHQGEVAGKNMAGMEEEYKISDVIIFNLMGKSLKARWWE